MNPLASHWLRLAFWLLLASPIVGATIWLTEGVDFVFALVITLYIWAGVCVILALIALAGLIMRVVSWGVRAIRR